jgi:uncharacterized protein (DUF433 family)
MEIQSSLWSEQSISWRGTDRRTIQPKPYQTTPRTPRHQQSLNFMTTSTRIVKTADVLHGKPRIEGTRIGVLQIGTRIRDQDFSVDDVAAQFDLDAAQVEAALEYFDEHSELMETLRTQHEACLSSIEDESRAK